MTHAKKIVVGTTPKYRQLAQILRSQILTGELPPNTQLPTGEELAQTYCLSRGTVRQAVSQLEAEGLVRTEQGLGSFVCSAHPNAIPFHFYDPLTDQAGDEVSVVYEVLEKEVEPASLEVAQRLRLSPGAPVIHLVRLRKQDGEVVAYVERYLPESACPGLLDEDLIHGSVHTLLVAFSELPLLRAEFQIEAHVLTADEAHLLRTEPGAQAVVIDRMTFGAPNRPAVWYRALYKCQYGLGVRIGDLNLDDKG